MSAVTPILGSGSGQSSATSRSWLDRVRAGDASAWDRLVTLYAPLVFHWCRSGQLQTADTENVLQEVFLAVSRHIGNFRKQETQDTFRGWLRTITHNKIMDYHRRQGREPHGEGGTEANFRWTQLPEDSAERSSAGEENAIRSLFRRALSAIQGEFEPRTWQAFWASAIDGRAPKDVALDMQMSAGAVRVAKSRVLQRLREELGEGSIT